MFAYRHCSRRSRGPAASTCSSRASSHRPPGRSPAWGSRSCSSRPRGKCALRGYLHAVHAGRSRCCLSQHLDRQCRRQRDDQRLGRGPQRRGDGDRGDRIGLSLKRLAQVILGLIGLQLLAFWCSTAAGGPFARRLRRGVRAATAIRPVPTRRSSTPGTRPGSPSAHRSARWWRSSRSWCSTTTGALLLLRRR